MFDSSSASNYENAFTNTNLSETSIDNILVSIDTSAVENGIFTQTGGSKPSVSIGNVAIDSLLAKGWRIQVTGLYGYVPPYSYYGGAGIGEGIL